MIQGAQLEQVPVGYEMALATLEYTNHRYITYMDHPPYITAYIFLADMLMLIVPYNRLSALLFLKQNY